VGKEEKKKKQQSRGKEIFSHRSKEEKRSCARKNEGSTGPTETLWRQEGKKKEKRGMGQLREEKKKRVCPPQEKKRRKITPLERRGGEEKKKPFRRKVAVRLPEIGKKLGLLWMGEASPKIHVLLPKKKKEKKDS